MAFIHTSDRTAASAEALARDFKNVVSDAEELLRALGKDGNAELDEMRTRVRASLDQARDRLGELQSSVVGGAKAAAGATDEYVHHNPWAAVGFSVVVGGLIGYLIGRR